jgi:hypothetical protein
VDPALDSEGCGIRHTNCTDDDQNNVENACHVSPCNGSVVKHGLYNISRDSVRDEKSNLQGK